MQRYSVHEFAALLFKCRNERNPLQILNLHSSFMCQPELHENTAFGTGLVSLLLGIGKISDAQQVFEKIPRSENVSAFNLLIAGYVKCNEPRKALNMYERMVNDNSIYLNDYSFVSLLKACSLMKDLWRGELLHADIDSKGLVQKNVFIGCALIDMFAKCGNLAKAHEIFHKLSERDVVSWNAMITGFSDNGRYEEALNCYEQMQYDGISGNPVTLVCCLKACSSLQCIDKGREMHADIVSKGFETELLIRNTLVDVYARCGLLTTAQDVFNKLDTKDVVSWNTLIGGFIEHGHTEAALDVFENMQDECIYMSPITFSYVLKACSCTGTMSKGRKIHVEIAKKGMEVEDLVGGSLVDMYAKSGSLADAQSIFDSLPIQDVVSWTAIMAGYTEQGQGHEALGCFEHMVNKGICPDAFTFSCSLKACGSAGDKVKGLEIHAKVVKIGIERDILIGNTLVNMYAMCGLLSSAHYMFKRIDVQDVVAVNSLIVGYAEHGFHEEAIQCFEEMGLKGLPFNHVTAVCTLKSCNSMGRIVKGRKIHVEITKAGLGTELTVGNTLIDMYIKASSMEEAEQVFNELGEHDIVSWTALIAGYAQLGETESVFHAVDRMLEDGVKPNLVTFVHCLNACNHAGLVNKGEQYFRSITDEYDLMPTVDHYTCMVDLLGRSGHIAKALTLINRMPMQPDLVVWHTALGACRKWGDVVLGRHAFEQAVRLNTKACETYLFMYNIYVDANMLNEAEMIEEMRLNNEALT